MAEFDAKPVSMRCKICGGNLANDYFAGACRCENCGNKWNLSDLVPNYKDYQKIIEKLNRAAEMLDNADDPAKAGQAFLMYKSTAAACMDHTDAVGADLMRLCKEGQDKAVLVKHYTTGKSYLEKDNCRKALAELEKVKGFRDADILAEQCREKAAIEKKKRIPYAVIIGMIIPAVACILLKEKAGLPIAMVRDSGDPRVPRSRAPDTFRHTCIRLPYERCHVRMDSDRSSGGTAGAVRGSCREKVDMISVKPAE